VTDDCGPVLDVDAVAVDGGTEAEGVARAPARRDDAFPIKNYCAQSASVLDTRGRFADPPTLLPTLPQGTIELTTIDEVEGELIRTLTMVDRMIVMICEVSRLEELYRTRAVGENEFTRKIGGKYQNRMHSP
jgi:hypothetical protein